MAISRSGRYVSYAEISPVTDGGLLAFDDGQWKIRRRDTSETWLLNTTPFQNCSPVGFSCYTPPIYFDEEGERAVLVTGSSPSYMASYSPGTAYSFTTGTHTPLPTFTWLEHFADAAPDFSWALVKAQSYGGGGGAIRILSPLSGTPQLLTATSADPGKVEWQLKPNDGGVDFFFNVCTNCPSMPAVFVMLQRPWPTGTSTVLFNGRVRDFTTSPLGILFNLESALTSIRYVPLDGGPDIALANGTAGGMSPTGAWAVVYETEALSLFDVRDVVGAPIKYQPATTTAWVDDSTLAYVAQDGGLHLVQPGGVPELIASDILAGSALVAMNQGVLSIDPSTVTAFFVTAADSAVVSRNAVRTVSMRAFYFRNGSRYAAGASNLWFIGRDVVLREHFVTTANQAAGVYEIMIP